MEQNRKPRDKSNHLWTARSSIQSILMKISPGCLLEGLMLKLKLQYFGYLMQTTDSFEKILMLRKTDAGEGDDRGWDGWMASPTQWTWIWASSGSLWWTGKHGMLQSMGSQRIGHNWGTELNQKQISGFIKELTIRMLTKSCKYWEQNFFNDLILSQVLFTSSSLWLHG